MPNKDTTIKVELPELPPFLNDDDAAAIQTMLNEAASYMIKINTSMEKIVKNITSMTDIVGLTDKVMPVIENFTDSFSAGFYDKLEETLGKSIDNVIAIRNKEVIDSQDKTTQAVEDQTNTIVGNANDNTSELLKHIQDNKSQPTNNPEEEEAKEEEAKEEKEQTSIFRKILSSLQISEVARKAKEKTEKLDRQIGNKIGGINKDDKGYIDVSSYAGVFERFIKSKISGFFKKFADFLLGGFFKTLGLTILTPFLASIALNWDDIVKKETDNIPDYIAQILSNIGIGSGAAAGGALGLLFFGPLGGLIGAIFGGLSAYFAEWVKDNFGEEKVKQLVGNLFSKEALGGAGAGAVVGGLLGSILPGVGTVIGIALGAIIGMLSTSITETFWPEIKKWTEDTYNLLTDYVNEKINNIKNWFSEKWHAVIDPIVETVQKITQSIVSIFDFIVTKFTEKVDMIKEIGNNIKESITEKIQNIVDLFTTIKSKVFDFFDNLIKPITDSSAYKFLFGPDNTQIKPLSKLPPMIDQSNSDLAKSLGVSNLNEKLQNQNDSSLKLNKSTKVMEDAKLVTQANLMRLFATSMQSNQSNVSSSTTNVNAPNHTYISGTISPTDTRNFVSGLGM